MITTTTTTTTTKKDNFNDNWQGGRGNKHIAPALFPKRLERIFAGNPNEGQTGGRGVVCGHDTYAGESWIEFDFLRARNMKKGDPPATMKNVSEGGGSGKKGEARD